MKTLKTLVAASVTAAALFTTLGAAAQSSNPANARAERDAVFGEFIYDSLGATPKLQVKAAPKADAKVAAEKDKAVAAKQDTKAAERTEAAKRDELAKY